MAKFNSYLKNKASQKRKKKIERIENNLEKGRYKFIFLYGMLLWGPLWLIFWILLLDVKILNVFTDHQVNSIIELWSVDYLYGQLMRLPVALFLGYINAVSHWHYLHRRLQILKRKINRK